MMIVMMKIMKVMVNEWNQLASQSQQNDIQYKPPMVAEGMVQYHVCSV
jgi:hypothetical protein